MSVYFKTVAPGRPAMTQKYDTYKNMQTAQTGLD